MSTKLWLEYASFALVALCVVIPLIMWRKGLAREFRLPMTLLCVQGLDATLRLALLYFRRPLGLQINTAYTSYFWGTWVLFVVEGILRITIIYSVFHLAMRPMQGLHRIGKLVFRWVAAVSVIVALGFAAGPRVMDTGAGVEAAFSHILSQSQQGISILTLCLLLFVCFATKPLGLTYRSHLFGVSLGLGVLATTDLVQAAWFSTSVGHSLYSGVYLFGTLGIFVAFATWGLYFALPEPKRKLILLPTTSPFFFWNRISEALGDNPGHVAIAGFHPEMLAAAELDMLTAPSRETFERPESVAELRMPSLQRASQY